MLEMTRQYDVSGEEACKPEGHGWEEIPNAAEGLHSQIRVVLHGC